MTMATMNFFIDEIPLEFTNNLQMLSQEENEINVMINNGRGYPKDKPNIMNK